MQPTRCLQRVRQNGRVNKISAQIKDRHAHQSATGRDVLAGEIVAGTAAVAAICAPCGTIGTVGIDAIAQGALIGEVTMGALGAESAAIYNGDISKGLLEGVAVGAVTGALGGFTNAAFPSPAWEAVNFNMDLGRFVAGNFASNVATDFGSGATVAYAGGRGNLASILRAASSNAVAGLPIDLASTLGQFAFAQLLMHLGSSVNIWLRRCPHSYLSQVKSPVCRDEHAHSGACDDSHINTQ